MKKTYFLALVFLFLLNNLQAQWTKVNGSDSIGLPIGYSVTSVAFDSIGAVYVSGSGNLIPGVYSPVDFFKLTGNKWSPLPMAYYTGSSIVTNTLAFDNAYNVYAISVYDSSVYQCSMISRWNGSSWDQVTGIIFHTAISAWTSDRFGNMYFAMNTYADSLNAPGLSFVEKWDGTNWTALDSTSTILHNVVYCMTTDTSGNLYVAGNLKDTLGEYYVAKWDGSAWSVPGNSSNPIGAISYFGPTNNIISDPAGNIYISNLGFLNGTHIGKWDGTQWTGVDSGIANISGAMIFDKNGNLFTNEEDTSFYWNGSKWIKADTLANVYNIPFNSTASPPTFMTKDKTGKVYIVGNFVDLFDDNFVATWDGTYLQNLSPANSVLDNCSGTVCSDSSGAIYAIGSQQSSGVQYIIKWNGSYWEEVGSGNAHLNAYSISGLVSTASGTLYAISNFGNTLHQSPYQLVKWNGTAWSDMNNIPGALAGDVNAPSHIYMMQIDQAGNIYVVNHDTVYADIFKYNIATNTWVQLGSGTNVLNTATYIKSIATDDSDNVYAAGHLVDANGYLYVAKWSGTQWNEIGPITRCDTNIGGYWNEVYSVACDGFGAVYALVSDTNADYYYHVYKWDGNQWNKMGSNIFCLNPIISIDKYNNIYVGGSKDSSLVINPNNLVASASEWNGTDWSGIDNSLVSLMNNLYQLSVTMYKPDAYGNWYADYYSTNNYLNSYLLKYSYNSFWAGCTAPVLDQQLCMVTIDTVSQKALVIWDKVDKYATDSFYIYRTTTPGTLYTQVGAVSADSLSEWIDTSSDPDLMSYRYKISLRDTCGRMDVLSSYHQTIYLSYLGAGQFSWTPYVIEDTATPVASYGFYRDSLGNGNWQLLQSLPSTQTSASDPSYAQYPNARYLVLVNLSNPCNPTRGIASIASNILSGIGDGIANIQRRGILIAPNPAQDNFTIYSDITGSRWVSVTDMLGRIAYQSTFTGQSQVVASSGWAPGIYTCEVLLQNGQVYRAQLVKQ